MRTTLDIDADVLLAARDLARRENATAGAVISELIRRVLTAAPEGRARQPAVLHGFRPFPKRGGMVTDERIDALRHYETD
jgi:hypothetical protein